MSDGKNGEDWDEVGRASGENGQRPSTAQGVCEPGDGEERRRR